MAKADLEGLTLFPLSDLSGTDSTGPLSVLANTPLDAFLEHLYFTQVAFDQSESGYRVNTTLVIDQELVISPFGELMGLVLGGGNGLSSFDLTLSVQGTGDQINFQVGVVEVPVALRISGDILRPLLPGSNTPDPNASDLDISLGAISLFFDPLIGFDVVLSSSISLPRCMIADSGIIVSAPVLQWLTPYSDNLPANTPLDFTGLYLDDTSIEFDNISLEDAPVLKFDYAFIGSGGFTGKIEADNLGLRGSLLSFECELVRLKVTLAQGALIASDVYARLKVPYFDEPVGVEIGINFGGEFTLALSATQPPGLNYTNGLVTLNKPGLLTLTLESIRFALDQGIFTVALSGEITPDVGNLDWPSFRVDELSIDSQGNVKIEGGWLDLREQYMLSFYGFQLEITKIGFGSTNDGQRWIGFSGGLKLVEGLTAGASVEGMRIIWDPKKDILHDPSAVSLTLNGVGVELDIPNTLYFKGWVSMTQPLPGIFRFDGDITLSLKTPKLEVESQLVIGYDSAAGYTFFAIYLGVELPAGIPLGNTSLAIYGMAGLFALNMEPGRLPEEAWYAIQQAPSWYHKLPEVGVANLRKWDPHAGSLGLGAGITIGTLSDNGMTFNGRFLLVLILPGPIIMLEGRTNILKERTSLRDEPIFRSLAVIDGRDGTFLVGLDAQYLYDKNGSLIEVGGGTEAFFDFNNPGAWHLYLGIDEPRDRRIRAEIFKHLFEANGYFMVDAYGLRQGAWIGYDKSWDFGPLSVTLQAWLEGAAELSSKPQYFSGDLWLHGAIEAKIFSFGFGLGTDARIAANVFDPFHVVAELTLSLDLPWPFQDVSKSIPLEWPPELTPPLLSVPLKEVAIEHFKVTTSWPLPAIGEKKLLLPTPDPNNDGFWNGVPPDIPDDSIFPLDAPVVPLDARPHITFGRAIHDLAGVGINPSPVQPDTDGWEWIGDRSRNEGPARVKLSLLEMAVERRIDSSWITLASQLAPTQGASTGKMFGSWAPVPQLPGGNRATNTPASPANVKLWLWSRSPFDYTQRTGGEWEEWFTKQYPDYPCIAIPADEELCCDFADLALGAGSASPWACPEHPEIVFGWRTQPRPMVSDLDSPSGVPTRCLCFPMGGEVLVLFGYTVKRVRIFVAERSRDDKLTCVGFGNLPHDDIANPVQQGGCSFEGRDFRGISLQMMRVVVASTDQGPLPGLNLWWEMEVKIPSSAAIVEIQVSTQARPIEVEAFDSAGNFLSGIRQQKGQKVLETLRLQASVGSGGISLVRLRAPGNESYLHSLCYSTGPLLTVSALALDLSRQAVGTYFAKDGAIEIPGEGVRGALVNAQGKGFCLTSVCVLVGPDDEERAIQEEMIRHVVDGVAHWESDGEVLPPWSQFRLKIVTSLQLQTFAPLNTSDTTQVLTQYAYFRTEGPPGLAQLALPIGSPLSDLLSAGGTDAPAFDSGLNDLTRYVAQTVPPTVPSMPGEKLVLPRPVSIADAELTRYSEKPLLPRPVYCAYDVGVRFNESYVDQMYAIAGRDLSLYLFDNNDRPARDAYGHLLMPPNRWGRQSTLSLTRSEERWLSHLDTTTCATIDWSKIARDKTLESSEQVLAADTLYEARLIPLLLHETFTDYAVSATASAQNPIGGGMAGGWTVTNVGIGQGQWIVREGSNPTVHYIEQNVAVSRGAAERNSPFPGGTFLLPGFHPRLDTTALDQPVNWTDYRASVYVRSIGDNPVGLAVRWSNGTGYLAYLDRKLNRRRLIHVDDRTVTVLAEVPGGYQPGLDSHIAMEASGNQLRVFLDGEPICNVQDGSYAKGCIALFASDSVGTTFRDIRVDDLRTSAPVVYRFKFTTSRFANFTHHVHSFRDMTFVATLPDLNSVPAAVSVAIDLDSQAARKPPTESEAAAYETLAAKAVGTASHQLTDVFDVTRIEHNGQAIGFLIRTGEPIDWVRTTLNLSQAAQQSLLPDPPTGARLVAVTFATGMAPSPLDEFVTVLLDQAMDLTGWRIEHRAPDVAANPDPHWQLWYTFGKERLLAAGRKIRIFPGQGNTSPTASTGEDLRFGNASANGFRPAFASVGVDLRLVAPNGRSVHMRCFLPDLAYTSATAVMLRAVDGTGLILLRPSLAASGSQLSASEYRLRWEYRRDNTKLDFGSLVLSQSGDSSPEIAQIDIPWSSRATV